MSHPAAYRATGTPAHPQKGKIAERTEHFLGQTLHMTCRLRDHIERLDSGVTYAVDDLAVTLRAMLSTGKGNDVLRRLSNLSAREFEIQLSRPPALDTPHFSVGSVPVCGSQASEYGAVWVPLSKWASRPVLRVKSGKGGKGGTAKNYQWGSFLDTYANKWGGAHLDKELPTDLPVIDMYEAGGHLLSAYLIRAAAVQVWYLAQTMLSEALGRQLPEEAADAEAVWLGTDGAILRPPRDTRNFGELHYFNYTGEEADFLAFYEPGHPASMRIAVGGGLIYDMQLRPPDTSSEATPPETQRARNLDVPKQIEFSDHKMLKVTGRVLTFADLDPNEEAAGEGE